MNWGSDNMNEEELSNIMSKITSMMNNNTSNDYENSKKSENSNTTVNFNSSDSNNFNIDIETMLKIKKAMDKINNNQNNPRTNLLLSLKPYLKPSRKDKVDQYIKLLNMENMLEIFKQDDTNNNGGDNKC